MKLQDYLDSKNLWNETALAAECVANSVYIKTSDKYPGLVLLHYMDEVSFGKSWNEFNMMCRGAILDMRTKKVIAWPFNKFFNLGEHTSDIHTVVNKGKFIASEKLDGSMLILFPYNGKNYFTTKGSFDSEHAEYANQIMPESLRNLEFKNCFTMMFELLSENFRNVINYKKLGYDDGVYLIGVRFNDGQLATTDLLKTYANAYNLKMYKTFDFGDIEEAMAKCSFLPATEEGYVLKFDNEQFLVKIKGQDYLIAHKIMKGMNDNAVVEAMELGKDEELITYCPEEYRDEIKERFNVFRQLKDQIFQDVLSTYHRIYREGMSRKEYAISLSCCSFAHPCLHKFLFKLFDNQSQDAFEKLIYRHIREHYVKDGVYNGKAKA